MGLMDRVKQVAGEVGDAAKKGASQVQTKVEQTQLRRRADDAAKRLGYAIYRERTGGAAAGTDVDALVAEIRDAEDEIAAAESQTDASADAGPATAAAERGLDVPPPAPGAAIEEATGE